jgi:hypothetical protein
MSRFVNEEDELRDRPMISNKTKRIASSKRIKDTLTTKDVNKPVKVERKPQISKNSLKLLEKKIDDEVQQALSKVSDPYESDYTFFKTLLELGYL